MSAARPLALVPLAGRVAGISPPSSPARSASPSTAAAISEASAIATAAAAAAERREVEEEQKRRQMDQLHPSPEASQAESRQQEKGHVEQPIEEEDQDDDEHESKESKGQELPPADRVSKTKEEAPNPGAPPLAHRQPPPIATTSNTLPGAVLRLVNHQWPSLDQTWGPYIAFGAAVAEVVIVFKLTAGVTVEAGGGGGRGGVFTSALSAVAAVALLLVASLQVVGWAASGTYPWGFTGPFSSALFVGGWPKLRPWATEGASSAAALATRCTKSVQDWPLAASGRRFATAQSLASVAVKAAATWWIFRSVAFSGSSSAADDNNNVDGDLLGVAPLAVVARLCRAVTLANLLAFLGGIGIRILCGHAVDGATFARAKAMEAVQWWWAKAKESAELVKTMVLRTLHAGLIIVAVYAAMEGLGYVLLHT